MKSQPHQSLSKLDAATRQLHLAIDLFFKDADPIGVHTLAGAAHGILRGLAHTGGRRGARRRGLGVERASRRLVESKITDAKNFLKHADRDPTRVLQFHPSWTDFLMFDAIRMHIPLGQTITSPNCFFLIWLSSKYPRIFFLDDFLGSTDYLSELRRIFPSLGDPSAQKRTFQAAMNQGGSSGTWFAAPHDACYRLTTG